MARGACTDGRNRAIKDSRRRAELIFPDVWLLHWIQHLAHIYSSIKPVPKSGIITPDPNARYHANLSTAVFLPRNPLCLLHQESAETPMLKFAWITAMNWHGRAIHVQLTNETSRLAGELG